MGSPSDHEYLLEIMMAAAAEAGERIMAERVRGAPGSAVRKADSSPVTAADIAAHQVLIATLKRHAPDIPAISEEGLIPPFEERRDWHRVWLVDPLDGTREYVRGSLAFSVNIALVEANRAVLGVIGLPAPRILYTGFCPTDNPACWRAEKYVHGKPLTIATRPLESGRSLRMLTSSHHGMPQTRALRKRLSGSFPSVSCESLGSAAKMALIAEGAADLYPRFGPTCEWDTAAGQALLEAAGGGLFTLDGRPRRYNAGDSLLNPSFYAVGDTTFAWSRWFEA
ncbi:MAG: 3'(2'),5'-bisphosphate nucleotidase CysQ [Porticoccaceae bacterium]|nr:3'(2'),5'-bisphosphate nucleotidase CysQ [Porticoccaceae bacterium]